LSETGSIRGTGLLAIFCDLESRWREEFRPWLREEMFPARLGIGFRACASYDAVPGAPETSTVGTPPFLTLYECPAVGDLYGEPYQALRRNRGERDRAFHERMISMERYTLAAAGPPLPGGGEAGLAPYVFVDRFDVRPGDAEPFNIWYECDYAPWCAKIPGLVRLRRYLAVEGAPRHFLMHEFAGQEFCDDKLWRALRRETAWSYAGSTHGSPGLYRRVEKAP